MPHSPPPNERAIRAASANLDKLLSQAQALRAGLAAARLPIAAAEDRLDHSDDLAAILISQLNSAANIVNLAIERAEVDYAREHGLSALNETAAVRRDFTRWTNSLRTVEAA